MKSREFLRAVKDADADFYREALEYAAESGNGRRECAVFVKKIIEITAAGCMISAAVFGGFFLIRALNRKPIETVTPGAVIDTEPAVTTTVTETTAAVTEVKPQEPVMVSDRLYRVFDLPQFEAYEAPFVFGTMFDAPGTVNSKTLDFSKLFSESPTDSVAYCVRKDQSAVYAAHFGKLYRTDTEMQSAELLLDRDDRFYINALLSFPNTELLYFDGRYNNVRIIGSFDPESKQIKYSRAEGYRLTPCNTGVLLSDVDVKRVYYWECGSVYEIPLTNWSRESNETISISANGKYLCTFMGSQTKDGLLTNRCSVYDVKNGNVIGHFDWVFQLKYGRVAICQFEFLGFDEDAKQLYVKELSTMHLLRFDFGD